MENRKEAPLRQCLVGSLNGAFSSKRVTEEFIKVSLARMEIGQDVQTQKLAWLRDIQVEQVRKQKLVTRRLYSCNLLYEFLIERPETPDKSYSGDNRLVLSERPQRRQCSAPRCRLALARGCRSSQAFGCSPIKILRELGSDRFELKIFNSEQSESSEEFE